MRFHVAVIMDGNGRWAAQRRLPRSAGHRAGADAVRRTVEAAPSLGITDLTLYAFSSDNFSRPATEVAHLMALFQRYLTSERRQCVEKGIRVSVIGRRDRLAPQLLDAIHQTEQATRGGTTLHLRIAVDYSARDLIVRAAAIAQASLSRQSFSVLLGRAAHGDPVPDVDLLIRTGREKRISDFLLWEIAYAELYFSDRMWPDFDSADLELAVQAFRRRERRFGAVIEPIEAAISDASV